MASFEVALRLLFVDCGDGLTCNGTRKDQMQKGTTAGEANPLAMTAFCIDGGSQGATI
jgi:hypothetical protein